MLLCLIGKLFGSVSSSSGYVALCSSISCQSFDSDGSEFDDRPRSSCC